MAAELPKIKLYWLDKSRAQRILFLLEELNLPYEIDVSHRKNMFAPATLQKVHPLGKSPILSLTPASTDSSDSTPAKPVILAESGFIVQYLCDHFSTRNPSLVPPRWQEGKEGQVGGETEAYMRFAYLLHYAEGTLMPFVIAHLLMNIFKSDRVPFFLRPMTGFVANQVIGAYVFPNARTNLAFLEDMLKTAPGVGESEEGFLCGKEMTAADVLMSFNLVAAKKRFADAGKWKDGSIEAEFPRLWRYLARLEKREGFVRSVKKIEEVEGRKYEAI